MSLALELRSSPNIGATKLQGDEPSWSSDSAAQIQYGDPGATPA
jgi:hypothetical protein